MRVVCHVCLYIEVLPLHPNLTSLSKLVPGCLRPLLRTNILVTVIIRKLLRHLSRRFILLIMKHRELWLLRVHPGLIHEKILDRYLLLRYVRGIVLGSESTLDHLLLASITSHPHPHVIVPDNLIQLLP